MAPISQHSFVSTDTFVFQSTAVILGFLPRGSPVAPLCEPELTACKPQSTSVQQIENDEMILAMKTECLDSLKEYVPTTQMYDTRYFLETFAHHLPLEGGKNLMKEIIKFSVTPEKLRQLRNFLRARFSSQVIDIMLKFNLPTNPKLTMASRDSASRKKQEDLEASCLKRDGYRCVLRGAYQEQYFMTQLSAHEKTRQYWEEHTVAHILPHVLGGNLTRKTLKSINKAEDAIILAKYLPFNDFRFGFEPTREPHTYRVHVFESGIGHYQLSMEPRSVTFRQNDARNPVPLPDPHLLRVHYALGKMFNLSQENTCV
ncbi:uncharacterized protein QC764_707325 [Podospora pseudoanserina]|uniref:HNH nuclease domain-containing protein n=1 Tax=Podospora pseudoanserina TaxID=2609844 RepID=A0ABR0HK34_9PEZI|nr:hypothetical protein QC764_707325 [Podospora pseudoanserina]